MSGLGLAGYGSDDDDSSPGQGQSPQQADKPILLGSYASADALDDAGGLLRQPSTFNAAPDVQEPSEVPAPSSSPQQDSGDRALGPYYDVEPPSRPASTAPQSFNDPASITELYLSDLPAELRYPPKGEPSQKAMALIKRFQELKKNNKNDFVDSLRKHRDYSNPNLLQSLVEGYELNQYGTAFPKDIYDPDALPKEDHIKELLAGLERDQEERRNKRAANPAQASIAFERGGALPASQSAGNLTVQAALQQAQQAAFQQAALAGRPMVGAGALQAAQAQAAAAQAAAAAAAAAQSQQGKKRSKWDSGK